MAFFTTFYSFKGGVGRSLALANIATALAHDINDPCRVLAWDFDLAAPGLQNIFKPRWRGQHHGFVDHVHHYITTAEINPISDYIVKTDVDGVDILPAGGLDRKYANKLEDIKWRQIYREARGFQFIEAVKKQINDLRPAYDYILIDSLTGYSDVGGICVRQLPDAVVFLFRLNSQNLDGIKSVLASLLSKVTNRARIPVIPVVSPVWPFASLESNKWLPRAQRIFKDNRLLEISFEGALTYGEPIISKTKKKFVIAPRIVQEYETLAQRIRRANQQDSRTMLASLPSLRRLGQFKEAVERSSALIRRRSNVEEYWDSLVRTFKAAPAAQVPEVKDMITHIIDDAVAQKNIYAVMAKATIYAHVGEWELALASLKDAVSIDPKRFEAYEMQANIFQSKGQHQQAIKCFTSALQLSRTNRPTVRLARANSYMKVHSLSEALGDFNLVLELEPRNSAALLGKSRALFGLGQYDETFKNADKYIELEGISEQALLMKAYALLGLGEEGRAVEELKKIEELPYYNKENIAEAYLGIDPKVTLKLLSHPAQRYRTAVLVLKAFAAALLGDSTKFTEFTKEAEREFQVKIDPRLALPFGWDFFESKVLVKLLLARNKLRVTFAEELERLISKLDRTTERAAMS